MSQLERIASAAGWAWALPVRLPLEDDTAYTIRTAALLAHKVRSLELEYGLAPTRQALESALEALRTRIVVAEATVAIQARQLEASRNPGWATPIEKLALAAREKNGLLGAGLDTVEGLVEYLKVAGLQALPGVGAKSEHAIRVALAAYLRQTSGDQQ